jgi:hypothetical protein
MFLHLILKKHINIMQQHNIMEKHPIVFSYEKDEHIPVLLGYGHNLKNENLCYCKQEIVSQSDFGFTVKKSANIFNKDVEVVIEYDIVDGNERYRSGAVCIDNIAYEIDFYGYYNSLQIGEWCYDRIGVVKLSANPFT